MTNKRNIMKKALALAALIMVLPSCAEKEQYVRRTGDDVTFSVKTSGSEVSKAAYATTIEGGEVKINWEKGDLLRIYCAQVSEPADQYADYEVTETGDGGTGNIDVYGEIGLRWGSAESDHVFYAAYPSPAAGGIVKSDTDNTGKTVSASLPATQAVIGNVTGTTAKVAAPDLKNMLMVATTTVDAGKQSPDDVSLDFRPLTTAIEFTIKNGTGSDMKLKSVSLISGDKKESAPAINGAFSVDLDDNNRQWTRPDDVKPFDDSDFTITYTNSYPSCTGTEATTDMTLRTSTIDFGSQQGGYVTIPSGESNTLTFTFFLVPTHDFKDLTLKLAYDGGSWVSYHLCYDDGDGIYFPKFKKTAVTGLLVPGGAQWTVTSGATPYLADAGDNIFKKPQPDDEIWYTTSDGKKANLNSTATFGGLTVVSNTYTDGKGIIKLSGTLKTIGSQDDLSHEECFKEQQNLTKVYFPLQVESIGRNTIRNCYYISEIYIPVSVTSLHYNFCWDWTLSSPCLGEPLYIIVGTNRQSITKGSGGDIILGNGTEAYISTFCFVKGTMISLSDGSSKKVEELSYDDELMVWNFDEGKYDSAKLLWISNGRKEIEYYKVTLSDGTIIKLCGSDGNCHRLFNYTDKVFQYPTKMEIGTEIFTQNGIAELVSVECIKEDVTYYNLITDEHINCFADGILTSCRYNNLYPIDDGMKFVKDGRKVRPYSEFKAAGISREWYNGLRLGEQTDSLANITEYIYDRIAIQQPKPAPTFWQKIKTWWKSIFG